MDVFEISVQIGIKLDAFDNPTVDNIFIQYNITEDF